MLLPVGADLSFDEACSVFDNPLWCAPWRDDFERSAGYLERDEVQVPRGDELAGRCAAFGFPAEATDTLLKHRDSWDEARCRRMGAHYQYLCLERYAGRGHLALGWPPPPTGSPLLFAYAALGAAGQTQAQHRAMGISADVSADTLWDIGQQVRLNELVHGSIGMKKGWWLCHHLANHLFALGRLQFQRWWAGEDAGPIARGDAVLDVHIPESGRLSPEACDASFAQARDFFPAHFPDHATRWFTCSSWLLDPKLTEILPKDSNIVRFQQRFQLVEVSQASGSVFEFVFYRPDLDRDLHRDQDRAGQPDLAALPRRTRLERALVDLYQSGGRIHSAYGVIPLHEEIRS